MRALFYLLAIVLIVVWSFKVFVHAAGALIHLLLVVALVFLLLGISKKKA